MKCESCPAEARTEKAMYCKACLARRKWQRNNAAHKSPYRQVGISALKLHDQIARLPHAKRIPT